MTKSVHSVCVSSIDTAVVHVGLLRSARPAQHLQKLFQKLFSAASANLTAAHTIQQQPPLRLPLSKWESGLHLAVQRNRLSLERLKRRTGGRACHWGTWDRWQRETHCENIATSLYTNYMWPRQLLVSSCWLISLGWGVFGRQPYQISAKYRSRGDDSVGTKGPQASVVAFMSRWIWVELEALLSDT